MVVNEVSPPGVNRHLTKGERITNRISPWLKRPYSEFVDSTRRLRSGLPAAVPADEKAYSRGTNLADKQSGRALGGSAFVPARGFAGDFAVLSRHGTAATVATAAAPFTQAVEAMPAVRAYRRRLHRVALAMLTLVAAAAAAGLWIHWAGSVDGGQPGLSPLTQGCLAAAWTAYVLAVFFRRPDVEDDGS